MNAVGGKLSSIGQIYFIERIAMIANLYMYFTLMAAAHQAIGAKTLFITPNGANNASCGTASLPCRTLQYTLYHRSSNNDTILIDGRNGSRTAEYLEEITYPISILYNITLQGIHGTPVINFSGTETIIKINGKNSVNAGMTIKDITFKMNSSLSTIFSLSDASFHCYQCTFQGMMTAIDFKWGRTSDLSIQRSLFKGVRYGITAQHGCTNGTIEISNSSFNGERGVSNTGFQLTSSCIRWPYPKAHISILIERTYITGFSIGIALSVAHITLFEVTIEQCNFNNQKRGTVLISIGRQDDTYTKIKINNSSFLDNEADSGGAVYISSSYKHPANMEVNITNCSFERNSAKTMGGAVAVQGGMTFRAEDSYFAMNDCRDIEELHYNYGQGSGGALGIDPMGAEINAIITGCVFKNNAAYSFGGAIYAKESPIKSNLLVSNSTLESVRKRESPAIDGDLVYSAVYTKIGHVKSRIQPIYGSNAIHLTGQHGSTIDRLSVFRVTPGYLFHLAAVPVHVYMSNAMLSGTRSAATPPGTRSDTRPSDAQSEKMGRTLGKLLSSLGDSSVGEKSVIMYREFSLSVFSCPYNHYNLKDSVFNKLTLANSKCHTCPKGGICPYGILKAKDNFWGYLANQDQQVKFFRLLENYGCTGDDCANYHSCAKNRTGQLCATCRPGFSESFLSTSCISNNNCNSKMFWAMTCIFILIYIPLFLYKKELLRCINYHLLWFWQQNKGEKEGKALTADYVLFQHQQSLNTNVQDSKEDDVRMQRAPQQPKNDAILSSFIKIFFYFYQVESVLNMQVSDVRIGITKEIRGLARNVFNFKFAVHGSSACFNTNATPVEKILLRVGIIGVILVILVSLYVIALLIERLHPRKNNSKKFSDRILPTLFEVFLQAYAIFVFATFKLIKCVKVNGKSLLYVQGTVECYVYWQYLLIILAVAWVLPFCIIVFPLPHLLMKGRVRRSGLFVACALPLPYIIYTIAVMVASLVQKRNGGNSQQSNEGNNTVEDGNESYRENNGENNEENNEEYNGLNNNDKEKQENDILHSDQALNSILEYMTGSFIKGTTGSNEAQYLWWDGMLMLRKLIIIFIASLIEYPYIRLYLLLLAQIFFLLHHVHAKPFNSRAMNAMETLSLILLTLFGAMMFLHASKDGSLTGVNATLSTVFAWLNIISTSALPILACQLLGLLILLKICHVAKVLIEFIVSKL